MPRMIWDRWLWFPGKWSRLQIQIWGVYYKRLCKAKNMNEIAQCGKIVKMMQNEYIRGQQE